MKIERVYLWSDLPADIAVAQGMKSDSIFNDLDSIEDKSSDEWWVESQKLQSIAKTKLAEKLWLDIFNGKLLVRRANGDPLDGDSNAFHPLGVNARECPDFCVRGAGCRTYPCSCSLVVNVLALQGQGHVIHMSGQLGG